VAWGFLVLVSLEALGFSVPFPTVAAGLDDTETSTQ
jgi:hypothetical protein